MNIGNKIYLEYYQIDRTSFHEKVRFYERNQHFIQLLGFEEKLEIQVDYLFALFEIGKYRKYLNNVDSYIELVIIENIFKINGRNVFEDLLFHKAACLYNLERFKEGLKVVQQLLKINPTYPYSRKLYRHCLRKSNENWYEINKAIAIVFLLSGISVVLVQLLVVDPFYEQYAYRVAIFRNFLFLASAILLVYNEGVIRWRAYKIGKSIS